MQYSHLFWHSEHCYPFQHLGHLHVGEVGKVVHLASVEHICDTPQGCLWYLKLCFRPYPEHQLGPAIELIL